MLTTIQQYYMLGKAVLYTNLHLSYKVVNTLYRKNVSTLSK